MSDSQTVAWSQDDNNITPRALEKRMIELTKEFQAKGVKVNLLAQIMFQVAKIVETTALQKVATKHYKTGRLLKAVKKRKDRRPEFEGASENYQVYVNKGRKRADTRGAYYWTWVHFGSIHNEGDPFLTDSFEENKGNLVTKFSTEFPKKLALAEKRVQKIK